jgi:hypothetical protein
MGATTDFRRAIEENRLLYLSTLEAYRASTRENNAEENDLVKIITQPRKDLDIAFVNHNYYITKERHLRLMGSNQIFLKKSIVINLMSALEQYLKATLRKAFASAPKIFSNVKSRQELELGYIIRLGSYSNITSGFIEKEVRRIGERSLHENGDFFKKNLDMDFQRLGARWDRILQASKYRNSIIHHNSTFVDELGRDHKIDISHWFIIQLMDDLYALSVEVGRSLREKIEKYNESAKSIEESAIVLIVIESSLYDDFVEFRPKYTFYDSSNKLRQFSELNKVTYSRDQGKVYVMIRDNYKIVSSYIVNLKKRHKDLDRSEFRYYKIYNEDPNNLIPDWPTLEKVSIALGYGLEVEDIITGVSTSSHDTKIVERAIHIIENSLPENAVRTISTLLGDDEIFDNRKEILDMLSDEYLFDRSALSATLQIVAAQKIHLLLSNLHLSY